MRFMITDNQLHPKTYEITKVMDTFPLGATKIVLSQSHFNEHTDLCGVDEEFFGDKETHMICDFYKSNIKPVSPTDPPKSTTWSLSEVNEKLYVHGSPQIIQAIPSEETTGTCEWHIYIDNEEIIRNLDSSYTGDETFIQNYESYINGNIEKYYLQDYFDITIDNASNTFTITAISKDLVNYIIKVAVKDVNTSYNHDFVEMEVAI